MVQQIFDQKEKSRIAREILEALPEWFAVKEAREDYIRKSADWAFFAAFEGDCAVGFLCVKQTGDATAELAVMGVRKEFHRRGVGRGLFAQAKSFAAAEGYEFMQVKTVRMGMYEDYDRTNLFYKSLGFKEFEVIPAIWGETDPCQIYVMSLR